MSSSYFLRCPPTKRPTSPAGHRECSKVPGKEEFATFATTRRDGLLEYAEGRGGALAATGGVDRAQGKLRAHMYDHHLSALNSDKDIKKILYFAVQAKKN